MKRTCVSVLCLCLLVFTQTAQVLAFRDIDPLEIKTKDFIEENTASSSIARVQSVENVSNSISSETMIVDIQNMSFGYLEPGVIKTISGDNDMNTTNAPTIKNQGYDPLFIQVAIEPLVGTTNGCVIDDFAINLGNEKLSIAAPQTVKFIQPLKANEAKGLSFYVKPPRNAKPDSYEGNITISGYTEIAADNLSVELDQRQPSSDNSESVKSKQLTRSLVNVTVRTMSTQTSKNILTNSNENEAPVPNTNQVELDQQSQSENHTQPSGAAPANSTAAEDNMPPQIGFITKPPLDLEGATSLLVSAKDERDVRSVICLVDNKEVGVFECDSESSSYHYDLDTRRFADGAHNIMAKAIDCAGNEAITEQFSIEINNNAPDAPKDLVAEVNSDSQDKQVKLTWTASQGSDLAGYNIYRKNANIPYSKINAEPVKDLSFFDEGLINDVDYCYVVKAVDTGGKESQTSNEIGIKILRPQTQSSLNEGSDIPKDNSHNMEESVSSPQIQERKE